MHNIIITALLIGAFFMCVKAYTLGLKHGKQLSNNQVPQLSINPVKPVVEAVQEHKKNKELDKLENDFTDIMGATRETMLNSIKKEVR